MRLVIALCRYCVRQPDECEYRKEILDATKPAKFKGTVTHNCPIYRTLVPVVSLYKRGSGDFNVNRTHEEIIAEGEKIGARVKVMLKELDIKEEPAGYDSDGDIYPPETIYEWIDVSEVMGTVVFAPGGKSRFFGVRLDDPVDLVLPERGKNWDTAHEQRVEERWLPANKLNFITEREIANER